MEIKLLVSLDKDSLGAVNALTQAIQSISNSVGAPINGVVEDVPGIGSGPVYWQNSRSGEYGMCDDAEKFESLRSMAPKYVKEISKDVYDQLDAADVDGSDEDDASEEEPKETPAEKRKRVAAEKKAADAKTKAAADKESAAAKRKVAAEKKEAANPTKEDIKSAFMAFMNKDAVVDEDGDFDEDEYQSRKDFLTAVTQRLGARPTELDPELRGQALELLNKRIEDPDFDLNDSDVGEDDEGDMI